MKKYFLNKAIIACSSVLVLLATSCTKVDTNDDVVKGDPPPIPGGYTNSSQVATANLVGYWPFDGSVRDMVSNTNGTNSGMTFSAGLKGQAIQGGGANSQTIKAYASAIPSSAITSMTQYTVSCWVNTQQNDGATGVFSIGHTSEFWGNINIFLENGGTATKARFKTIFRNGTFQADNNIQDVENGFNKWTNYTISYNNTGVFTSYVNGVVARTATFTTGAVNLSNPGPIIFGTLHFMTTPSSTSGSTSQPWAGFIPGKIDEVRIYNKALTANEIFALFTLEKQGR